MDAGVWSKDEKRREKLVLAGKQIGLAAHQQTWCWETTPGALRWSGGMELRFLFHLSGSCAAAWPRQHWNTESGVNSGAHVHRAITREQLNPSHELILQAPDDNHRGRAEIVLRTERQGATAKGQYKVKREDAQIPES